MRLLVPIFLRSVVNVWAMCGPFLPFDVTYATSHARLSAFFRVAAEKAGKPSYHISVSKESIGEFKLYDIHVTH